MNKDIKKNLSRNKIIRRRRVFLLRRMIFIGLALIIFLIVLINSPIFRVKYVDIIGNEFLTQEYVLQEVNGIFHKNIFFDNFDKELNSIKENKYVTDIKYEKKYPNRIEIIIEEIQIDYYIYYNNEYYIFDRNTMLVDVLDYLQEFKLVEIIGLDFDSSLEVGKVLLNEDSREVQWLSSLGELFDLNTSSIKFDYVDLSNIYDAKLGYNNLEIYLGNTGNLKQKLNNAINIINSNENFSNNRGYIDVRSINYPVVSFE